MKSIGICKNPRLPRAPSAWHFILYASTHRKTLCSRGPCRHSVEGETAHTNPSPHSTCKHLSPLRSNFYFPLQSNIQVAGDLGPKKKLPKAMQPSFNITKKRLSWTDSRLVMSIIYLLLNLFHLPSQVSQWQIDWLDCAILLPSHYSVSTENGMSPCESAIKGKNRPPWPSTRSEAPCAVEVKNWSQTSSHFITEHCKVLGDDAVLILYIHT